MQARHRLLFVTQQLPWPLDSGGNIRTHHLLQALAERIDVTLVSSFPAGAEPEGWREALGACEGLRVVPADKGGGAAGKAWSVLKSLVAGRPAVVEHNFSPAMAQAVAQAATDGRAPFVHFNHIDTLPYRRFAPDAPFCVDTHNVMHQFYGRRAEQVGGATGALMGLEARRVRRFELEQFRAAREVFVCSEPERDVLHGLDSALRPIVVPNGVDTASFQPREGTPKEPELVFLGDMAYPPNHAAALEFIEDLLPRVRAELPEATFRVVGKNPQPELQARADATPGVEVTGFVDDVRAEVQRARLFVVPLRNGSGTRLKILEAMALGVPVVSTRIGAEGIEARDGEELRLADEPADFAAAVVELCREPEGTARCEALSRAARARVEERYDWQAIARELARRYSDEILSGTRTAR